MKRCVRHWWLAAAYREAAGPAACQRPLPQQKTHVLVVAADLTTAANRFGPVNELVASGAALTSGWVRTAESYLNAPKSFAGNLP